MRPIRFPARGGFHETVKQRVEQYFADSRRSTTGAWRLFVKTGVILACLAGSYALLVFGSTSLPVTMLAVFALAQGCALVGFNIMRDGAHERYAHSKTINRLMGGMLNVIGGSQRLWRHKHNRLHHIYTNIHAIDGEFSQALFGTYRSLHITTTDDSRRRRLCRDEAVRFWLRAPPALMLSSVATRAPELRGRASALRGVTIRSVSTRPYRRAHQLPHPGCARRYDAHARDGPYIKWGRQRILPRTTFGSHGISAG